MRPSDYPDGQREVFETFSRETEIKMRVVSCIQAQQALTFAENFQLWELVLVVAWIRSRIEAQEQGRERTGYNRQSLQWHCIFGSDGDVSLACFDQKLGVATQWAKRNAPRLLPASEGAPVAAPAAPAIHKATPGARQLSPEQALAQLRKAKEAAGI